MRVCNRYESQCRNTRGVIGSTSILLRLLHCASCNGWLLIVFDVTVVRLPPPQGAKLLLTTLTVHRVADLLPSPKQPKAEVLVGEAARRTLTTGVLPPLAGSAENPPCLAVLAQATLSWRSPTVCQLTSRPWQWTLMLLRQRTQHGSFMQIWLLQVG